MADHPDWVFAQPLQAGGKQSHFGGAHRFPGQYMAEGGGLPPAVAAAASPLAQQPPLPTPTAPRATCVEQLFSSTPGTGGGVVGSTTPLPSNSGMGGGVPPTTGAWVARDPGPSWGNVLAGAARMPHGRHAFEQMRARAGAPAFDATSAYLHPASDIHRPLPSRAMPAVPLSVPLPVPGMAPPPQQPPVVSDIPLPAAGTASSGLGGDSPLPNVAAAEGGTGTAAERALPPGGHPSREPRTSADIPEGTLRDPETATAGCNYSNVPVGFPMGPIQGDKDKLKERVNHYTSNPETGDGGFGICRTRQVTKSKRKGDTLFLECYQHKRSGCKWSTKWEHTTQGWVLLTYNPHCYTARDDAGNAVAHLPGVPSQNGHSHELLHTEAQVLKPAACDTPLFVHDDFALAMTVVTKDIGDCRVWYRVRHPGGAGLTRREHG